MDRNYALTVMDRNYALTVMDRNYARKQSELVPSNRVCRRRTFASHPHSGCLGTVSLVSPSGCCGLGSAIDFGHVTV